MLKGGSQSLVGWRAERPLPLTQCSRVGTCRDEALARCQVRVCRGDAGVVKSLARGLPASGLALLGTSVHLSKCPGPGPLGSVQRTPGDQERSRPTLPRHGLLQQVQAGGFAQTVSFRIATSHLSEPLPQLAGGPAPLKVPGCQDSSSIPPKLCFVTLLNPLISTAVFSSVK